MNQPPPQYGVPPQQPQYAPGPYPQYPNYPPPKKGMGAGKIVLIVVLSVVGLMFLFGALVGVLAVATVPKLHDARSKLEAKQIADVRNALQYLSFNQTHMRSLQQVPEARGHAFYDLALREGVLDPGLAPKLTSLNGKDIALPASAAGSGLPAQSCSYTAPGSHGLEVTMSSSDSFAVVTFNSRNWNNYPKNGVLIAWNDKPEATWLTFEQANTRFGITQEEWNDPAGKLYGKKAPFQHTYE